MNIQLTSPKDMAKTSIEWFVGLVVLVLAVRFLFHLFGATAGSEGFVSWLYETSGVLLQPFRSVFSHAATSSKYVLDFPALFAMVAYMALGNVAMGLVDRWSPKRR